MIYQLQYNFLWMIKSFGIYLEYSYKLHGYKQDKRPLLKKIGLNIVNWSTVKIEELIEYYHGYQGGGGWCGDELEGVDDVEEYISRKESIIRKNKLIRDGKLR